MADLDFLPSPEATVVQEGRRDVALVFLGGSLVTGYGDPKGQGWVTRVVGRTQHPDLDLTSYNLGVRGATSTEVLERWRTEVPARWTGRSERRLVLSTGSEDIAARSMSASRLNSAAASSCVRCCACIFASVISVILRDSRVVSIRSSMSASPFPPSRSATCRRWFA